MTNQYASTDGPGLVSGATIFLQAQAGDLASLNQLMSQHDGLVQAMVRRQVLGDLPFAEALQAGRIGLWRAILGFDPARGFAFSTYACPCIMRQVWRAVKLFARDQASTESDVEMPLPATPDPVLMIEATVVREALAALVGRLPRQLRYVIVARYGLDGHAPAWFCEIGVALGVSREWARLLHMAALVWLRQPAHSQELRSLLEYNSQADFEWADRLAQAWLRRRGGRHGR
jgi:RNA polymerase sigma factor (sigma-70 family)